MSISRRVPDPVRNSKGPRSRNQKGPGIRNEEGPALTLTPEVERVNLYEYG